MRTFLIAILTMTSLSANAFDNVYFDGTTPYFDANNTLIFDGVRAKGTGISLNDALRFEYKFDLPSLDFIINKQTTYTGIGVFSLSEELMAINVTPSQPSFTVNRTTYQSNTSYTFTATDTNPFIAILPLKPSNSHYDPKLPYFRLWGSNN